MRVSEIMSKPVVTVHSDVTIAEAAKKMLDRRIGCVVVVDKQGNTCGILTERDFIAHDPGNPLDIQRAPYLFGRNVRTNGMEAIYEASRALPAHKVMRPIAVNLVEDDAVEKAMDQWVRHGFAHQPVLRNGKPVGMVSRHDLMRLIYLVRPNTPVSMAPSKAA
jgi:CBS domain-containing protein